MSPRCRRSRFPAGVPANSLSLSQFSRSEKDVNSKTLYDRRPARQTRRAPLSGSSLGARIRIRHPPGIVIIRGESNVYGRQSTDPPRSLEATTEREHQVEDRPALNVVLRRLLVVRHLLACGCKVGAAELEPESPMPRCGFAAGCRQPSPCGRAWMAHSHAAGPARPSRACREPRLLQPAAAPPKISRCWGGGMPSFSSTLSLMREIVSSLSMSISISLPVSVFTLICHRAEARSAYRASPKLGSAARHARSWLEKGGWTVCAVLSQRPAQARRTLQAAGNFSDSGHRARPALGLGEQRRACPRASG